MLLVTLGLSWVEYSQAEPVCAGKHVDLSAVKQQVGKKQFFHCEKYWARLFFICCNTRWSCAQENVKTPLAGLKWLHVLSMDQEEEKEEKYTCKQNKKILLQAEMEKQVSKWKFSLIPHSFEDLEDSRSTVIFMILYFWPNLDKKNVKSWHFFSGREPVVS